MERSEEDPGGMPAQVGEAGTVARALIQVEWERASDERARDDSLLGRGGRAMVGVGLDSSPSLNSHLLILYAVPVPPLSRCLPPPASYQSIAYITAARGRCTSPLHLSLLFLSRSPDPRRPLA